MIILRAFVLVQVLCLTIRVHATIMSVREPLAVPFYLYDGDIYPSLQPLSVLLSDTEQREECTKGSEGLRTAYWVTNVQWLNALSNHTWRTMDPEEAELFVIVYNVDESLSAGICRGETHLERTKKAVQTVENSPWYQRNHGRDHFWPMSDWKLQGNDHNSYPKFLRDVISNMTVGRYFDMHQNVKDVSYWVKDDHLDGRWWRLKSKWRCSLLTPVRTGDNLYKDNLSYEEWNGRGTLVFFRGKWKTCADKISASSREKVYDLNDVLPNVSISTGHAKDYKVRGLIGWR
ncbi:unnamed protein product [Choristocarpus tenellus]